MDNNVRECASINSKDMLWGFLAAFATALLFALILILRNMFPGQKFSLLFGDYYSQFYYVVRGFWYAVFHGESISFNFSWGMGLPTIAAYSGFAFSPFNILLYLIPDAEWAAFLTVTAKFTLAAFCFWYYLVRAHCVEKRIAVLFSMSYALSAFSLVFFVNFHHMDALYILPVLMCLIPKVPDGKGLWKLTLLYAYSFVNNFYNGYIIGIFSFLVLLSRIWYKRYRGKELISILARYFGSVLQAVLISMLVLFPVFAYIVRNMSGGSDFSTTGALPGYSFPLAFLLGRKTTTIFNDQPVVYCGTVSLLLAISFFMNRDEEKRERIRYGCLGVFLLICMFWKPAFLMMHAFNEPDSFGWRFSFLFIFLLITIAAREAGYLIQKDDRRYLYAVLFAGGSELIAYILFLVCSGKGKFITLPFIAGNLLLLAVWYLLRNKRRAISVVFWVAEIFVAGYFFVPLLPETEDNLQAVHKRDWMRIETSVDQITQMAEMPFYRIAVLEPQVSDSAMAFHFKGINFFSSIEHTALWQEMYRLGYSARSQQIREGWSTDFLNMVMSVAYIVDGMDGQDGEPGNVIIPNDPVLPPAFMASEQVLQYSAQYDPLMNQDTLADALCGRETGLFESAETQVLLGSGVTVDTSDTGLQFTKTGRQSIALWTTPALEGKKAYIYFLQERIRSGLNETNFTYGGNPYADFAREGNPVCMPEVIEMIDTEGTCSATLFMQGNEGTQAEIKEVTCAYQDCAVLEQIYQELLPGGMHITECGSDRLKGTIKADESHPVLFTTIPYDQGWHIRIDGEEMETIAILDGAFLGTAVPAGEHEIELFYRDDSILMGAECALAGLVLLLLSALRERRSRHAVAPEEDTEYTKEQQ